jgi:hypothetical protein
LIRAAKLSRRGFLGAGGVLLLTAGASAIVQQSLKAKNMLTIYTFGDYSLHGVSYGGLLDRISNFREILHQTNAPQWHDAGLERRLPLLERHG